MKPSSPKASRDRKQGSKNHDREDQDSVSTSSLSVLLAEDTPANQKIVRRVLGERGHEVTVVSNGREALDQVAQKRFDVVLMDVQMPVMDGYQTTAAIRERERTSGEHLPIVALTAHSAKRDREACMNAGMDDYVSKPIEVSQLIATLERTAHHSGKPLASADHCEESEESLDGETSASVINLAATMKRLGGDKELLKRFVEVFNEDAPQLLESLRSANTEHNSSAAMRAAHNLRGLAANFDAAAVVRLASEIEENAKQDGPPATDALLDQLNAAVDQLSSTLEPYGQ